jgi:hypothetical protein
MAEKTWKELALEKLSELFHVILAFVGIAVVILAASKTAKFRGLDLSIIEPVPRILLAVFGVLVIILAIYLWRTGREAGASVLKPKDYYGINILPLSPVSKVGKTDVSGRSRNLFQRTITFGFSESTKMGEYIP